MPTRRRSPDPAVDALAADVRITGDRPPARVRPPRTPDLGTTAFDGKMLETYRSGDWGWVECTASQVQMIRLRLARSQRYLSEQHAQELKRLVADPPHEFRTTLIVTRGPGLDGAKLAEGPVKGNLTSPELDTLDPQDRVVVWFWMHLPRKLGRRAHPEYKPSKRKGLPVWSPPGVWKDALLSCPWPGGRTAPSPGQGRSLSGSKENDVP
jgi:hypothetical protein